MEMKNWPLDLASGSCLNHTDKDNFLGGAEPECEDSGFEKEKDEDWRQGHSLVKASLCKEGQRAGATV